MRYTVVMEEGHMVQFNMRRLSLPAFAVVLSISSIAILMSCDNLLSGDEVKSAIATTVSNSNAQSISITIQADPSVTGGSTSISGSVTEKVGVAFSVSTSVYSSYAFKDWTYTSSNGGVVTFTAATSTSTSVLITTGASDIVIQANYYRRPVVTFSTPANNSNSQLITQQISLEFSQAMDSTTINLTNIKVYEKSQTVETYTDVTSTYYDGVTQSSATKYVIYYKSGQTLQMNYIYKIVLSTAITDANGVVPENQIIIYFQTGTKAS
jgi:methionine-rich copper-binding protein CopC